MTQAIAGVTPPEQAEVTIMTVWPSMASSELGRALGRAYATRIGIGKFFTLGKLIALAAIPLALALYFWNLRPWGCRRYRLTNRRVIIQRGMRRFDERWVALEDFDSIEVAVLPGQEWYKAGELIFNKGQIETFRLHGVKSPQSFRHTCLKAQLGYTSVRNAMERQVAHA
jgi:hypothetical protein